MLPQWSIWRASALVALTLLAACGLCGPRRVPGPRVRLTYEIDREQVADLPPSGLARHDRVQQLTAQCLDIIRNRLEHLGEANVAFAMVGPRIYVTTAVGTDGELAREVKRLIARRGRLEFRIVDDDEEAFYERLRPRLAAAEGVRLVHDFRAVALEADDHRRVPADAVESGAAVLRRFIAEADAAGVSLPQNRRLLYGVKSRRGPSEPGAAQPLRTWQSYLVHDEVELTGQRIAEATVRDDEITGQNYVSIVFDARGRELLGRITGQNVRRRLAIILDDQVNSAPVIQERISGGMARITMSGADRGREAQQQEARELARVLQAGELPVPLVLTVETHAAQ